MAYTGRTFYANESLYLNGQFISGVQTIDVSTDFEQAPIYVAGIGFLKTAPNKAVAPSIAFEQILTSQDSVLTSFVTGNSILNGNFYHNGNVLAFASGFLQNYTLSCKTNSFLRSSTSFNIYGGFSYPAQTGQFSVYTGVGYDSQIPDFASVNVSLNEAAVDRVVGFSLSVTFQNAPVYSMGSLQPQTVKLKFPVEVKASFDIEIDATELYAVTQNICQNYSQNVSIAINTRCANTLISSINMSGATLSTQRYVGQIGSNATVTFEYFKSYNSLPIFASDHPLANAPSGVYLISGVPCNGSTTSQYYMQQPLGAPPYV